MNVIIRLQNLPWSANASDIRQFFKGLQIPEGGVHIVGGEDGDAFIAFSSDEDARQAMSLNGGKIKEVKVSLLLSSRAEMQKVIEKARAASAFITSKMAQQLPSAEAFTAQFVNKKPPETASVPAVVVPTQQSLMANYLQHSVTSITPMMNFQAKPKQEAVPTVALSTQNPQIPLYYTAMNSTADYINYMNMASAAGNYQQIDSNKLRDLYNKESRADTNKLLQTTQQSQQQSSHSHDYNKHHRERSRSPMSSRYDSDEKRERKRRTRFSSPEKTVTAPPAANPLLQTTNPLAQIQQQFQPQTVPLNINPPIVNNLLVNNANVMSNSKMPNNIWDVPPPMNLNSYSSYSNNAVPTNNVANSYSTVGSTVARNFQSSGNPGATQYNTGMMSNNGSNSDVGTCIKVANIDKEATYNDIRKFFGGLAIANNDIKFLKDDRGNHTGVAFIRFVSSESKKQAVTKNGWQLKSTQIMITSISEDDFENGLDNTRRLDRSRHGSRENNYGSYKQQRNYSRERYNDRFRERSNSRERDRYSNNRNNRATEMSNSYNNGRNNNHYNSNNQNSRYNDRQNERGSNNQRNYNNNENNNGYNNRRRRDNYESGRNYRNFRDNNEREEKIEYIPDENFTVLIIDDLPDKNEADLFEAFPDILGITIDKYTAYCKFKTHEAAKAVLENRFLHYIRNKRVFIEKGAEAQYDDYAKKFGKTDNPEFAKEIASNNYGNEDEKKENTSEEMQIDETSQEQSSSSKDDQQSKEPQLEKKTTYESRDPRQKPQDRPSSAASSSNSSLLNLKFDCILIKNLDPNTKIEDIENFLADVDIQKSQMKTHILLDKQGFPCGDCFVELKNEEEVQKAVAKNNQELGPNKIQIMPVPREQVNAVMNSFGDRRNQNRPPPQRDWAPPNDFGNAGCVVMLSNLCYRATINDILDEFREFDIKPDSIIRRFNDYGQPTGNACINFNSPADASKACDEYNKVKILNRPVWLRRL